MEAGELAGPPWEPGFPSAPPSLGQLGAFSALLNSRVASAQGPASAGVRGLSTWAQALQPWMWVKTPLHNPH